MARLEIARPAPVEVEVEVDAKAVRTESIRAARVIRSQSKLIETDAAVPPMLPWHRLKPRRRAEST